MNQPPLAFVHLEPAGRSYAWIVPQCPLCGKRHQHGGGPITGDPRQHLGHRNSHCTTHTMNDQADRGYILVERCGTRGGKAA